MMKKLTIFILLGFLIIVQGCTIEDLDEPFCNCDNPIKDLEWLNEMYKEWKKNPVDYTEISMAMFGDEEIFIVTNYASSDAGVALIDCSGEIICVHNERGTGTCQEDIMDNITDIVLLWKNDNEY